MEAKTIYITGGSGQVVNRGVYASVSRDGGDSEIRIDTVPEDIVATSPDAAAKAATAIMELQKSKGLLSFRAEYQAD